MRINEHQLVDEAVFYRSPHQAKRPPGTEILLVVIHSIGLPPGEYGTDCVRQLFLGELDCDSNPVFYSLRDLRVSAHIFIRRDGTLLQFVPFDCCAWHAGRSRYKGLENCNDFSIGIELEGGRADGYMAIQYERIAVLCALLMRKFPTIEAILGHRDIGGKNKDGSLRKDDPWNFQWNRFYRKLDELVVEDRK